MMYRLVETLVVLSSAMGAFAVVGCAEPTAMGEVPPDDAGDRDGQAGNDVAETGRTDVGRDSAPDVAPDVSTEGDFLSECVTGEDCDSSYCIQVDDAHVCSKYCAGEDCPTGWGCKNVVNAGADVVFICVPNEDTLCRPCTNNTDCGQFGDLCTDLAGLSVCGRDCSSETACPEYYECATVVDHAGTEGRQCIPSTGQCQCTPAENGTNRPCVNENQWGICEGLSVCNGDQGWTGCTAELPSEEICDGLDNDCDGAVDEDLDPHPCDGPLNAHGQCSGVESCQGAAGWACDAAIAEPETCDGLDNDCDNEIDEGLCDDGNPCTDDYCDPANNGVCVAPPQAGACDDTNPCTLNDHCEAGSCTGTPKSCDDGNACTADSCVLATGACQNVENPCPASTTCMNYSHDANGCCVEERLSNNRCDDDDPCTVNDVCSNGECMEGTPYCQGRPCSNCAGDWGVSGDVCLDIIGPTCICLCL